MINNRQQSGRRRGRGGQRQNNNGSGSGSGRGPESGNRIDNRARGNAAQLLEKYKTLARDAQQSSDRVLTEYYLQFADHYFRVLSESRARYEENNPSRARQDYAEGEQSFETDDGDDSADEDDDFGFRAPQRAQPPQQREPQPREQSREQPQRDPTRVRDDRPRRDYNDDSRNRDDRARTEQARNEQPREDRPRDERPRRDASADRSTRAAPATAPAPFEPRPGNEGDGRPPRRQLRPQTGGNGRGNSHARDESESEAEGEARLDVAVLPPAISAAPVADDAVTDEAPAPRKRGRPRKDATIAPADG